MIRDFFEEGLMAAKSSGRGHRLFQVSATPAIRMCWAADILVARITRLDAPAGTALSTKGPVCGCNDLSFLVVFSRSCSSRIAFQFTCITC